MRFKRRFLFYLVILVLLIALVPGQVALAGGCGGTSATGGGFPCSAGGSANGNVTTVTTTTGGNGNGGGKGSGHKNNTTGSTGLQVTTYSAGTWLCLLLNNCPVTQRKSNHRGGQTTTTTFMICNNIVVTAANIGCETKWRLSAHVDFPGVPIDTRPYPATLNRWPTTLRVDALTTAVGTGFLAYIPAGGGSAGNPRPGDWRAIKLTLTLYPKITYPPQVYLEKIGWLMLPVGQLYTFSWPLPSHPAAGGGPIAGAVGQLQELPQDMPLYTNYARAPYGLACELDWQQFNQVCVMGPDKNGNYDCDNDHGHQVDTWALHSVSHDIPPAEVKNLPPAEAADLNGDGVPDAYWDLGIVIRRMNDAGSISDPVYAHSYSWGDVFYWAAREAQGEITFP